MFRLKKRATETSPIQKYIDFILGMATRMEADKLVFGVPCDDLPRVAADSGVVRDFFRDVIPAGTRLIPVWVRIHGSWHEWVGPPWYLLHEIVRVVGDTRSATVTVAMETNYCYSLTLRKADVDAEPCAGGNAAAPRASA